MRQRTGAWAWGMAVLVTVATTAVAYNVRNVTELLGVSFEGGNNIVLSDLAVAKRFYRKPTRFTVYMELTENYLNGGQVFLGSQQPLLDDLALVTPDGPNGRALYLVDWNTQDLQAGSSVMACAQVFKVNGRAVSDAVCNELDPSH